MNPQPSVQIAILARAPVPGQCKTRLIPALGAQGAARAQQQMLDRVLATAGASDAAVTLWTTPILTHPAFLRARRQGARLQRQPAGDLGRRMWWASRQALRRHGRVIVLGTDCPALTPALLRELSHCPTPAIIPAEDGGYVALALSRADAGLFRYVNWGSAQVLRQTLRNLRQRNVRATLFAPLPDLDTPSEWRAQRRAGMVTRLPHRIHHR